MSSESILASFGPSLERIGAEIKKVTNLNPESSPAHLYRRFHFGEGIGRPRLLSRNAREVRITTKNGVREIFFQGFVQVEVFDDQRIRVLAGYLSQPLVHGEAMITRDSWKRDCFAPAGSAELINGARTLQNELLENLPEAMRGYVAKVQQILKS